MPPRTIATEITFQIGRKSTVLRLFIIFILVSFLGVFSARAWARAHFETVAYLLEIQHGYEGVSVGYSGFGSLLISLIEARGTFFVKNLKITRDREVLQRRFTRSNRAKYPDLWPATLSFAKTVDDSHVRVDLIMNSWVLGLIIFAASGASAAWLIVLARSELTGREKLRIALAEEMAAQARQVAHDIRSPVAALELASRATSELPEKTRLLIVSAVGRIHDIANSLADRKPGAYPASEFPATPRCLAPLIDPVVNEKRLEFSSRPDIKIEFRIDESAHDLYAVVEPVDFKRMLSNLINNSAEAFDERGGTVTVKLNALGGRAQIIVDDDGKGIAPDIIAKLGRRGETHGKAGGTGLGLYHARTSAESWGGSLKITSDLGKGTTTTVDLPQASGGDDPRDTVLIDDDPLMRMTWKIAASRAGIKFSSFATLTEFLEAAPGMDRITTIYIDADLGEGVNGARESVLIRQLGFDRIYLATGHPAAAFSGLAHLSGVVGKEPPWPGPSIAPTA